LLPFDATTFATPFCILDATPSTFSGVAETVTASGRGRASSSLEKPIFRETDNSFLVTIKHEKLATAELTIMDYLETHDAINNKQARGITYIHEDWKVKGIFRRMEEKKMIKQLKEGTTSNTKYRKRTPEDDRSAPPETANLFST
jgi:ATP-dependent DNA helicase RecG